MILVTVGTIHYPFDRMVALTNRLSILYPREKIVFQHGATSLKGLVQRRNVVAIDELDFFDLQNFMAKARCIVCHGGPATIYQILSLNKTPFVFPRSSEYGEHVNDHQIFFAQHLAKKKQVVLVSSLDKVKLTNGRWLVKPSGTNLDSLTKELQSLSKKLFPNHNK